MKTPFRIEYKAQPYPPTFGKPFLSLTVDVLDKDGEFLFCEELQIEPTKDGTLVIKIDEKSKSKLGRF